MNRQVPLLQEGLLLGIALCSLLSPVSLSADTHPEATGTDSSQALSVDGEEVDSNNSATADQGASDSASSLHQDENHWRLRFNLSWVDPTGNSVSTSIGHGNIHVGIGAGAGAGLQAEYRLSPRLGIELGVLAAANFEVTSRISHGSAGSGISLNGFTPFSLGLNFHLTPEHALDFYAGPQLALVTYGNDQTWWDWDLSSGGNRASTGSDWAWGLTVGLDIPLGKRGWLFNTNLRYIETDVEQSRGNVRFDGEFDPVIFSVGFGYAF